jgi:hypothetical protein
MPDEATQPLEPRGPAPQRAEEIPNVVVQADAGRWKRTGKKQTPPPKFGIRHVLLWTACWGVTLALSRSQVSNEADFLSFVILAPLAFGYSAALLGLAICLKRRTSGDPWPIEPGEWLLVIAGVSLVLSELQRRMFPNAFETPPVVLAAVQSVLLVLPILDRTTSTLWRTLFLILLAIQGCLLGIAILDQWMHHGIHEWLIDSSRILFHYAWLLQFLLPALFAAIDYRRRKQYTWLHWLGIAAGVWLAGWVSLFSVLGPWY